MPDFGDKTGIKKGVTGKTGHPSLVLLNLLCLRFYRYDRNFVSLFVFDLKLDMTVYESVDSMVVSDSDIVTWMYFCTSLSDDDVTRSDEFAAEFFHT
jgi:hypothetical protein